MFTINMFSWYSLGKLSAKCISQLTNAIYSQYRTFGNKPSKIDDSCLCQWHSVIYHHRRPVCVGRGHKFPSAQRAPDTTLANIECVLSFAFEQQKRFFSQYSFGKGVSCLNISVANSLMQLQPATVSLQTQPRGKPASWETR